MPAFYWESLLHFPSLVMSALHTGCGHFRNPRNHLFEVGLMRPFREILSMAVKRHGSLEVVDARIEHPAPVDDLLARSDDRWLADMTRHVFNAGFSRKVIRDKWQGFEAAFKRFDPSVCAMMDDDWFDMLLKDPRIVRNGARIRSVPRNAVFILDETKRHGSFGAFIAAWQHKDFADFLEYLRKYGDRLGDKTAQYFLREAGVDSYVLSFDVLKRLSLEGVADTPPASSKQRRAIQNAFDGWKEESGKSLTYISRVLAMSVESDRQPRFT